MLVIKLDGIHDVDAFNYEIEYKYFYIDVQRIHPRWKFQTHSVKLQTHSIKCLDGKSTIKDFFIKLSGLDKITLMRLI